LTAKIILNPYAGRWKAQQLRSQAEQALHDAGVAYELVASDGPGDAIKLAAQAVQDGFSPIVAAGGDGTISEVVNGLWQATPPGNLLGPLGILPMGSANDLVNNLKLPIDLSGAAQRIANGQIQRIDLGLITFGDPPQQRCFDNNAAIGLEPTITLIQARMKHLRGVARYLVAALRGVWARVSWQAKIEWQGGDYQGPVSLVTIGNGAVTGGLFYMAPHAQVNDGEFTFVYGHVARRRDMLRLLPKTMKPEQGSYVEAQEIYEINSPWIRIHVEPGTPLHADGEIQSEDVRDIEFKILPQHLQIII